jgi:phosphodiesterase/alkaline phosphatase D-like protein
MGSAFLPIENGESFFMWNFRTNKVLLSLALAISALLAQRAANAADVVSYNGGTYTQNFDTLPSTSANSTAVNTANPVKIPASTGVTYTLPTSATTPQPPFSLADTAIGSGSTAIASGMDGWWSIGTTASTGNKLGAHEGSQTTGGLISYGGLASNNRAVGLQATSTTGATEFGLRLINTSTVTYNQITLSFTSELWRQTTTAKTISFGYFVDTTGSSGIPTSGQTAVASLDSSFAVGTSAAAVDGTLAANQNAKSATNLSISNWAPNQVLWLTWTMSNSGSGGQGIAIDDLSFSASIAPPVIGSFSPNFSYAAGQSPVTVAPTATVTSTQPNFNGGNLTMSFSANGVSAEDKLAIANIGTGVGQIGISGANVTFGGTTIGTFTGGVHPNPLVVTFNASATPAAAQALLESVTYADLVNPVTESTRTVQAVLDDGSGSGAGPAVSLTITVANNKPDLTVSASVPATGLLGVPFNFTLTASNGGVANASGVQVAFTLPAGLTFNNASGTNGFTFTSNTAGVVLLSGGTINNASSATITVNVTATATGTYTAPIGAAVIDPNNTIVEIDETNNASTAAATISLTSGPQLVNDSYTATSNGALSVNAANGVFANDNGFGHPLQVIVNTAPAHGTLALNGADGSFIYTPTAGYTGSDTFTYTASNAVQLWKTNLPSLGTFNGVSVTGGGYGSSLCVDPNSVNHDEYYGVTDRGPNVGGPSSIKVEPLPAFNPAIGHFKMLPNGTAQLEASIPLKDGAGNPYSGRVNTQVATGETIQDLNGNVQAKDPNGYDSEGLVALTDGTFWVSDEYGPFITHFDATGKQTARLSPFDASLPVELAVRVPNKGMEGLCITPDGSTLVGMMQGALQQSDVTGLPAGDDATDIPILRIITYKLTAPNAGTIHEYLYELESNKFGVSEISALTNTTFLVDERDGKFIPSSTKKLFTIDISAATDVGPLSTVANSTYNGNFNNLTVPLGLLFTGSSIEKLCNNGGSTTKAFVDGAITAKGITPVTKSLFLDFIGLLTTLDSAGRFFSHDKVEGVAVLNGGQQIVLSNDSDFGISGATGTPPYTLVAKTSPATGVQDDGEFILVNMNQLPTVTATATVSLTVNSPLIIGSLSPTLAQNGLPFSGSVSLSGGTPPYSNPGFSSLPTGLTAGLNGSNIILTGTPTQSGTFSGNISIKDATGATFTKPYTLNVSAKLFTSGNILVSRSVYAGTAATVTVGQALPGGGTAVADGSYPGVFNNETPDPSFGITSPIFIDQLTTAGTLVGTLPVPTSQVTTSFPSKSEIGLNQSSDGKSVTFMAYVAPPNTLDVSNANTPGHNDPTNPVQLTYQRAVVQFDLQGNFQVTPNNAYSGNNGRNAVLANGNYYMVGNAENSGKTPAPTEATLDILSNDTGVQMIAPGTGGDSTVVGTVKGTLGVKGYQRGFSITDTNPLTGQPYAPAVDKTGKDDNFRGITLFNNTLYCTKGSGGNGINTVYQVGTPGTLPTLASAGTTPLTVLPGLYAGLAANTSAPLPRFPFGIWFANATTLYVADEGDGTIANAGTDTLSGLQKWTLANGIWTLNYTLQNGLHLGATYAVPNGPNGEVYPTGINPATGILWTPATGGLRNISGQINADGTVTIYAVTSTVSGATDQGADPNQVVAITDNLSFTTSTQAAGESFTLVKQAVFGEVLRGVTFLTPQVTFDGVAAGDVTSTDVILWTRAQPLVPVNLTAQVATDVNFGNVVVTSNGNTDPAQDYTLKLNPKGLKAGTRYYYRFVGPFGSTSGTGTFKTAYAAGTKAPVHLAFSGDCDGRWRPFPSVADISTQSLDFFEFCGDTMYENANSPAFGTAPASPIVTAPEVNPVQCLTDLRRKYRENITAVTTNGNPSLQNFFASQANYTLLDNHELCSNIGTGQYQNGGAPQFKPENPGVTYDPTNTAYDTNVSGPFTNKTTGFMACQRAFRNYEPIREHVVAAPADPRSDGTQQMYTAQQWGKNLMFIHTDDRSYADIRLSVTSPRADNPQRTRLGATQLAWLESTLLAAQTAGTPWKVVVVSDPIDQLGPVGGALTGTNANLTNTDGSKSWMGGYRAERNALMKFIVDNKITNVVFLATDDHTNRVNELLYFPDPVNAPTVEAYVPTCFSIVAGPIGASGPENFPDHSIATLQSICSAYVAAQKGVGVNPIGLDPAFPGLHDVVRDGDPAADSTRGAFDFFSPDTENYATLDISADGKTLTVSTYGINSYNPNLFLEAGATGPVRQILSFQVDAGVNAITLSTLSASGMQGFAIPLSITPVLANPNFPQTVNITISGVPATATLSAGTNAGGGVWNLTSAQLTGLTLTSTVAGSVPLSVTATDLDGSNLAIGTATANLNVTVTTNPPPVAFNGVLVVTGTAATTGSLVAMDPDGEALTYAIVANGTKGTATITNASTGAFSYTAAANGNAVDSFTFTASDANGKSNTATVSVTLIQQNPTPVAVISVSIGTFKAPAAVGFDGSASTGNVVAYQWDFGDGTQGFGAKPVHTYTSAGVFTVTLIVVNPVGVQSAPATATVVVAAATPPPINVNLLTGKFNKKGATTFKLSVTLPAGTAPGSTVTVKINSFTATFTGVTAGKVAHSSAGALKITGQTLDFGLKGDATALFGSPAPTTGTKSVTLTVNSTSYLATPAFTTKGTTTSFK